MLLRLCDTIDDGSDHPPVDLGYEPKSLGGGHELPGGEQLPLLTFQPEQRLMVTDLSGRDFDDGLEKENETPTAQGVLQPNTPSAVFASR